MTEFALLVLLIAGASLLVLGGTLGWRSARQADRRLAAPSGLLLNESVARDGDTSHGLSGDEVRATSAVEPGGRPVSEPAGTARRWAGAGLALMLVAGAILLYLNLGRPDSTDATTAGAGEAAAGGAPGGAGAAVAAPSAGVPPAGPTPMQAGDMETMIKRLSDKLARDPSNGEGWALLARSHIEMGRHGPAAEAFAKAIPLLPPDAGLLADLADARVMADNRRWSPAASQALQKALAIDPKHPKALALSGTEAFERQAYPQAVAFWQRLVEASPAGSAEALEASANLAEARRLAAGGAPAPQAATVSPGAAAGPVSSGGAAALPGNALAALAGPAARPSAAQPVPAGARETSRAQIAGVVELAPELRGKADASHTVFVVARPVDGSGAPLAVLRARAGDLPLKFKLDDSHAMVAGHGLSGVSEALLHARLSATGDAMPSGADPVSPAVRVKLGAEGVSLVLGPARGASR